MDPAARLLLLDEDGNPRPQTTAVMDAIRQAADRIAKAYPAGPPPRLNRADRRATAKANRNRDRETARRIALKASR